MKTDYRLQHAGRLARASRRAVGYRSIIGSLGVGAIAMFFMDPQRGRRRRALVRDQLLHLAHRVRDARRVTAADIANRGSGLWAMTQRWLRRDRLASDRDVTERVRARLGRVVSHPHAIEVALREGHVILSGPILIEEVQPLVSAVKSVEGVRSVEDRLSAYAEARGVSALQGGRARVSRSEFLQRNWSPAARLAGGLLGTGMILCASRGRGVPNVIMGLLGGGLLLRSATNRELTSLWESAPGSRQASGDNRSGHAGPVGATWNDESGMTLPRPEEVGQNTRF
ncbi:MAG: BON domain-containing protein [Betaproteobacteria bacterium]